MGEDYFPVRRNSSKYEDIFIIAANMGISLVDDFRHVETFFFFFFFLQSPDLSFSWARREKFSPTYLYIYYYLWGNR